MDHGRRKNPRKIPELDPVMSRIRASVERSPLSLKEIGERMGYSKESASACVSQFLKTSDPRIGMVRRFAKAMGLSLTRLVK